MTASDTRRSGETDLRTIAPGTAEYRRWIDLAATAYPVMQQNTVEQRDAAFEDQRDLAVRQPEHRVVGAYRDGVLTGGMRVYDFTMCVRGAQVLTGGIGAVAVGLEHKRRGIARDLVAGFLAEYRERGAALAVLYPFRPDFYAAMGFGYGAKINQYRVNLASLPADGARERVRALGPGDADALSAAYHRMQMCTHGLIRRAAWRTDLQLRAPALRTFGYMEGERVAGWLTFEVRLGPADTTNRNELYLHEFLYETPAALRALLAFARSQSDQFSTLVINTQDPDFAFALPDPRNGSDRNLYPPVFHETNAQGLGVMYRAIDVPALVSALRDRPFGDLTCTVRVDLDDPFIGANSGSYLLRFRAGRPALGAAGVACDVDLAIGVADFSSLLMGTVRLKSLVGYGRAVLSDASWLAALDSAWSADAPQCLTRF
jgi:predicted acetyltransferase